MWPLAEPLDPLLVATLAAAIVAVVAFDRYMAYRANKRQMQQRRAANPVRIEDWVLGRAYRRVWNSDPGEFKLEPTDELYKLTAEHLRTHLIVVAPTGSGKTRSILEPALQLFKRTGAAAIYFDAKGDDLDPKDFHLNFDLDNPQAGIRLNVWSGRTPREMGERLGEALIPEAGPEKAYFTNNAKDTIAGLAAAHHRAYGGMPSLKQLLSYLRDPDCRADLAEELRNAGIPDGDDELVDLRRIEQLTEQKYDALGSLDTALAPLARGEIADLLATDGRGYSIEELLRQPVRIRLALPVGRHPRVAPVIGRLVLAQFTYAVISPDANKDILKVAVIDEAQNFVTQTVAKGMAMARENRGCFMLAFQNLSQIPDPTLREDILSAAGNKLVMGGVGDYDSEKFSRLFGSQERLYVTHSEAMSQGSNSSRSRGSGLHSGELLGNATPGLRHQTSVIRSSSLQQSRGSSSHARERPDFLPSEIRNLPQFHVLVERRDGRGEVTPATVVNLDRELTKSIEDVQALRLYEQTGRLEAISPQLPRLVSASMTIPPGNRNPATNTGTLLAASRGQLTEEAAGSVASNTTKVSEAITAPAATGEAPIEEVARTIAATLGMEHEEAKALASEAFSKGYGLEFIMDSIERVQSASRACYEL
jgi:type IV secretory pathway TraG/TraD family ATPase VirD4